MKLKKITAAILVAAITVWGAFGLTMNESYAATASHSTHHAKKVCASYKDKNHNKSCDRCGHKKSAHHKSHKKSHH